MRAMSIQVKLDEGLRQVFITVLRAPHPTKVSEAVLRLTAQRPELGGWDWIIDTRNPFEQATPKELDQIAAAFNAARSKQSYTIFISHDVAGTSERCGLLDLKFLNRRHLVAKNLTEAKHLIPGTMRSI
ncbi:MAG: hypothetical protein EON90_12855 [Brevundimonas sp.]|nr:MAG: hypothetical protein EON90_12855 [Brevundimonas sp.]